MKCYEQKSESKSYKDNLNLLENKVECDLDFRSFLEQLSKSGELTRISKEVSTEYEMSGIIEALDEKPVFFEKATIELGVEPKACLFIGDRYDVDLRPAKEIGMQILEVKGPEDIYDLASKIITKEQSK